MKNQTQSPRENLAPEFTHHAKKIDSLLNNGRSIKAALPLPMRTGCQSLIAHLPHQLEAAHQLVRRRYAWRGYQCSSATGTELTGVFAEQHCVTLVAQKDEAVLGTLTVRADSPKGLLAEGTYGAEIQSMRRTGQRVGELVKLAVEEHVDWRTALDSLVQSAYVVTQRFYLTHVVIEVNPRHERFYQRVFGFVVAACGRMCGRVGAPSVLMQLDLDKFGRRLHGDSTSTDAQSKRLKVVA